MPEDDGLFEPLASTSELEQLAQIRASLADEMQLLPSRHFPSVTGDVRLLRFLRGFDHSVPQATAAVRDMLAIRQRYSMDELH